MIAPGADLEPVESALDRLLDDRGPAGDRLGDDEVFQLFVGDVDSGEVAPEFQFDFSAAADRQMLQRVGEHVVTAFQDVEAAGDLAAVHFQRGRLEVRLIRHAPVVAASLSAGTNPLRRH